LATFWLQWHECASKKIIDSASQLALFRLLMECPLQVSWNPLAETCVSRKRRPWSAGRVTGVICDNFLGEARAKISAAHAPVWTQASFAKEMTWSRAALT
jgi:hypothetical protein